MEPHPNALIYGVQNSLDTRTFPSDTRHSVATGRVGRFVCRDPPPGRREVTRWGGGTNERSFVKRLGENASPSRRPLFLPGPQASPTGSPGPTPAGDSQGTPPHTRRPLRGARKRSSADSPRHRQVRLPRPDGSTRRLLGARGSARVGGTYPRGPRPNCVSGRASGSLGQGRGPPARLRTRPVARRADRAEGGRAGAALDGGPSRSARAGPARPARAGPARAGDVGSTAVRSGSRAWSRGVPVASAPVPQAAPGPAP